MVESWLNRQTKVIERFLPKSRRVVLIVAVFRCFFECFYDLLNLYYFLFIQNFRCGFMLNNCLVLSLLILILVMVITNTKLQM